MKNNLKEMRTESNMLQKDLAKAIGVARQTIVAIENEKYDPSLELAFKLGKFFGKPLEEIFRPETD